MLKLKYKDSVYEDREDSWLLQSEVAKRAKGLILDVGTGTGIQALTAAQADAKVLATDVNFTACKLATANAKLNKLKFSVLCTDLLAAIKPSVKFDLIIFNPPYLPPEAPQDIAWSGGADFIIKFLKQAKRHLKKDGRILLVWSSLTQLKKIPGLKILKKGKFAFEQLFVGII